jgi:transcriptional regulator with XRE-family HTH domain
MSTKARARRPHAIVWYRSKRGLSQGALAEAIGVSRDLIQKTERGTLPVSEPLAFKLAGYSGIHPEFSLITASPDRSRTSKILRGSWTK